MFIYIGKSIRTTNDELFKLSVEELFNKIKNPKPEFQERIKQLRIANSIDINRYKLLKRELPYFTCGNFHPNFRRKENFSSIQFFIIDLDHLSENEISIEDLKTKLIPDENIAGFFVSPSGDGLKILFRLEDNCNDSGLFSGFYKVFISSFSQKYNLQHVIDSVTSDVTRACFISWDPEAYFNPSHSPIVMEKYFTTSDFETAMKEIKEAEEIISEISKQQSKTESNLSSDILAEIKNKLNPINKVHTNRQIFIPPEIDELLPSIEKKLAEVNIQLIVSIPINYGRKIRCKAGIHYAELNLFYGKKGYSLVKTPKSGTNPELAQLTFDLLDSLIHPFYYGSTETLGT